MLAYFIYAMIAVVSIALLADIAGLRRLKSRRGEPLGKPSAFPQTKFAVDPADTRHKTAAAEPAADGTAQPRQAVNVLPGRTAPAAPKPRPAPPPDEHMAALLDRVMPDSHATEHAAHAGTHAAEEFVSEKTNVYMRPHEPQPAEHAVKRQGATVVSSGSARLVSLSGQDKGRSFLIPHAGIVVGRHPSCHVVVADPRVSGRHVWLGIIGGKVILRDLKSTNGTLLNAHHNRIREDTELRSGDTIFLGGHAGVQFRLMID